MVTWFSIGTDLGESLLDGLALLHLGEVVVVQGHVCHDGLLIWVWDSHVLHLQQLHDPKLPFCHGEGMLQVTTGVVLRETVVVEKLGPGMEGGKKNVFQNL